MDNEKIFKNLMVLVNEYADATYLVSEENENEQLIKDAEEAIRDFLIMTINKV